MDRIIQQTDYDALSCKLAAIAKGYLPAPQFSDPNEIESYKLIHSAYFNTLKTHSRRIYGKINKSISSSFPVMNIGTYLRTVALDSQIETFLQKNDKVQIINLGCGSDLRMFQLLNKYDNLTKYLDLDFKDSIYFKNDILWNTELFRDTLHLERSNETDGELAHSDRYKLISCDLKDTTNTMTILQSLTDSQIPTLVITECLLCYMPQLESQTLINSIISFYRVGEWLSYDPIGGDQPNDRFGLIMQTNLRESRNLEMPTLMTFNSKESYASRWNIISNDIKTNIDIKDMWEIFNSDIEPTEKQRLKKLQFLDEFEELKVMQTHYVLLNAQWEHAL
ncbi:hypothetical protein NCAS_0F01180 [Naumovozyma castellii]|uniref:Leucine carboxyl methyltransferase 1 n=1 Tax=Naumovozyma castellii TaxID=27288 RepID=G0VGI1_NAUCA|nr:hypothetical protein NCAS_0F01180 [Naumovozyma castellii CBS 4309]CCC70602.1 hypothetical protein NCAS_0F01180 [Naumovozyma castellii CBS 4309]